MTIKALIFDFDGLLMDTETTLWESWQWEWRRHGLELDRDGFFAEHGGDVNEERYRRLASAVGAGYDREASHTLRQAYRKRLNDALKPAPGVEAWLTRGDELGLLPAVASSSPLWHVGAMLEQAGLRERFAVIATGEEVAAHKPDPAVYLLALERLARERLAREGLAVRPEEAIAFEDTVHGVRAAQAAGMRCVAVPNPHADHARFTEADLLLSSAADLTLDEVLSKLGG